MLYPQWIYAWGWWGWPGCRYDLNFCFWAMFEPIWASIVVPPYWLLPAQPGGPAFTYEGERPRIPLAVRSDPTRGRVARIAARIAEVQGRPPMRAGRAARLRVRRRGKAPPGRAVWPAWKRDWPRGFGVPASEPA